MGTKDWCRNLASNLWRRFLLLLSEACVRGLKKWDFYISAAELTNGVKALKQQRSTKTNKPGVLGGCESTLNFGRLVSNFVVGFFLSAPLSTTTNHSPFVIKLQTSEICQMHFLSLNQQCQCINDIFHFILTLTFEVSTM